MKPTDITCRHIAQRAGLSQYYILNVKQVGLSSIRTCNINWNWVGFNPAYSQHKSKVGGVQSCEDNQSEWGSAIL